MISLLLVLAVAAQAPQTPDSLRVGERILLKVEGERALTDTFDVLPGPALTLPGIGSVPLAGVTRAQLSPYLQTFLGRYLHGPRVEVSTLTRVAVLGSVSKPGYYTVTPDATLADVMMLAGGPTQDAKMSDARVQRGDSVLVRERTFAAAVAQGATVESAGLTSGDQIVVPALERRDPETTWRIISIVIAIPVAIFGLVRLF